MSRLYIGPSDLAYAIGLTPRGDNNEPSHVETVDRILAACKKNNVAAGIHTGSLEYTTRYLQQGFNMVTLGADAGFMMRLAMQELLAARSNASIEAVEPGEDV
jgi:4-hydroxy-2-oxoheptanedioate aldolase